MPGMALNPREVPMDRPDTPPPAAQADGQPAVGG
jgi:hypothetical protein